MSVERGGYAPEEQMRPKESREKPPILSRRFLYRLGVLAALAGGFASHAEAGEKKGMGGFVGAVVQNQAHAWRMQNPEYAQTFRAIQAMQAEAQKEGVQLDSITQIADDHLEQIQARGGVGADLQAFAGVVRSADRIVEHDPRFEPPEGTLDFQREAMERESRDALIRQTLFDQWRQKDDPVGEVLSLQLLVDQIEIAPVLTPELAAAQSLYVDLIVIEGNETREQFMRQALLHPELLQVDLVAELHESLPETVPEEAVTRAQLRMTRVEPFSAEERAAREAIRTEWKRSFDPKADFLLYAALMDSAESELATIEANRAGASPRFVLRPAVAAFDAERKGGTIAGPEGAQVIFNLLVDLVNAADTDPAVRRDATNILIAETEARSNPETREDPARMERLAASVGALRDQAESQAVFVDRLREASDTPGVAALLPTARPDYQDLTAAGTLEYVPAEVRNPYAEYTKILRQYESYRQEMEEHADEHHGEIYSPIEQLTTQPPWRWPWTFDELHTASAGTVGGSDHQEYPGILKDKPGGAVGADAYVPGLILNLEGIKDGYVSQLDTLRSDWSDMRTELERVLLVVEAEREDSLRSLVAELNPVAEANP